MTVSLTQPWRLGALAVSALTLSACGLTLGPASQTVAPSGAFEAGLHSGYLALTEAEYAESDYRDTDRFGARVLTLAAGDSVAPEEISSRRLPPDSTAELTEARARLIAALDADAAGKAPDSAARAQVSFDCWMQETEENVQPPHIERCRSAFMAAMEEVDVALLPPPTPPAEPPPPPRFYTVYFDFDSAEMTATGRSVVSRIVADWAGQGNPLVVVGHADAKGSVRYNIALSDKRAEAVGALLRESGVAGDRLTVLGTGETNLAVPTEDGVAEPLNDRATVRVE